MCNLDWTIAVPGEADKELTCVSHTTANAVVQSKLHWSNLRYLPVTYVASDIVPWDLERLEQKLKGVKQFHGDVKSINHKLQYAKKGVKTLKNDESAKNKREQFPLVRWSGMEEKSTRRGYAIDSHQETRLPQ